LDAPDKYKHAPPEERIWRYIDLSPHPRDCWLWTGAVKTGGYGCFTMKVGGKKRGIGAHRAMFILAVREPPEGIDVLHECDNPPCVNPAHLFLGTAVDNIRDMQMKGRANYLAGSEKPLAKLDEASVLDMRDVRRRTGESYSSLARRFGVCRATAYFAVTGKNWKHVRKATEELDGSR
jgi:hypothetical protein